MKKNTPILYGILGLPLEHSLSPIFHTMLFEAYNIFAEYKKYAIQEKELPQYIEYLRTKKIHGLSVTAPYKYTVYDFCDTLSQTAQETHLVNTLYMKGTQLYGDNYDVAGISATLQHHKPVTTTACIIGTGATASSAIVALKRYGIHTIYVIGRNTTALQILAQKYTTIPITFTEIMQESAKNPYIQEKISVLINTIPTTQNIPIPHTIFLQYCTPQSLIFDVHYAPKYIPLLHTAQSLGYKVCNGYRFFVEQASLQYCAWNNNIPTATDKEAFRKYYLSL